MIIPDVNDCNSGCDPYGFIADMSLVACPGSDNLSAEKAAAVEAPIVPGPADLSAEKVARLDTPSVPGPTPTPENRSSTFVVIVTRTEGTTLGLDVDLQSDTMLRITRITDGLIAAHNKANPGTSVQAGDCIIEANGQQGGCALGLQPMLDECRKCQPLHLVICRGLPNTHAEGNASSRKQLTSSAQPPPTTDSTPEHRELDVQITRKEGEKLGIEGLSLPGMCIGYLTEDGKISSWNAENPHAKVCAGDVIVEVNGIRGDWQAMLQECKEKMGLTLKLRRDTPTQLQDSGKAFLTQTLPQARDGMDLPSPKKHAGMELPSPKKHAGFSRPPSIPPYSVAITIFPDGCSDDSTDDCSSPEPFECSNAQPRNESAKWGSWAGGTKARSNLALGAKNSKCRENNGMGWPSEDYVDVALLDP